MKKIFLILIPLFFVSVALALEVVPSPREISDPIIGAADLKTSRENIISSQEFTEYTYQKDNNGKLVFDENKNPVIKSQKQVVSYAYKSGETAPALENEIIEKRTENIVTRDLGGNKRSAQSGYEFYKEGTGWKQIKHGTTTKEAFDSQTLSFWGRFIAWASETVATSPGTMADDATVGTVAWTNPDNAKVSDNVYATATLPNQNNISHYLKATNFGFSIPVGATINGILVEIENHKDNVTVWDYEVKIIKSDGTIGTTNKGKTSTSWLLTDSYFSYGSSSDLWNETWAYTDINDVDFGMVISAKAPSSGGAVAYVDHIRITVYYTEGSTPTPYSQSTHIKGPTRIKGGVHIQ